MFTSLYICLWDSFRTSPCGRAVGLFCCIITLHYKLYHQFGDCFQLSTQIWCLLQFEDNAAESEVSCTWRKCCFQGTSGKGWSWYTLIIFNTVTILLVFLFCTYFVYLNLLDVCQKCLWNCLPSLFWLCKRR